MQVDRPTKPPTDKVVNVRHLNEICSPSNPCHSHCCLSGNYCLLISIQLENPLDKTAAGVSIPTGALMDKIIRLYLSPIIADITQIVVLSNMDFFVYKGWWSKGKGMTLSQVCYIS